MTDPRFSLLLFFLGSTIVLTAQSWDTLALADFSAFQHQPANWSLVSAVTGRPTEATLRTENGTGLLFGRATRGENSDLLTRMEHGDLELELEFMLAEGGNSGIYLQGNYEIQLADSWYKARPTQLDAGAIYPRTDPETNRPSGGKPPLSNAAKAPGLWQHLRVSFRAPRFDEYGQKTEDARLLLVRLNGVTVQENVTLRGPTSEALGSETDRGPLRLQYASGEIAFRHIRIQAFDLPPLKWEDLRYESGQMKGQGLYEFPEQIEESGELERIDAQVVDRNDQLALRFIGNLELPESGLYTFELDVHWNARLLIDEMPTNSIPSHSNGVTQLELPAGKHQIVLEYYKWDSWYERKLALYLSGPGLARQALHEEASLPVSSLPTPHFVDFGRETKIFRGFTHYGYGGEETTKLTHSIQVGFPAGLAFTYDPLRAVPVQMWRGEFLDATPMWAGRGDGSVAPRGAVTVLDTLPLWLDNDSTPLRPLGYTLDEAGVPTFAAQLGELVLSDRLTVLSENRGLGRQLSWTGQDGTETQWRLASGRQIERLDRGIYLIDGGYFIRFADELGRNIELMEQGGRQHLVVKTEDSAITYEIVW